jgi:ribosomal protein S20
MNDQERIKQEIRNMIKSVGHAELEEMFGDVLAANYTVKEVTHTVKRARRRGILRRRR